MNPQEDPHQPTPEEPPVFVPQTPAEIPEGHDVESQKEEGSLFAKELQEKLPEELQHTRTVRDFYSKAKSWVEQNASPEEVPQKAAILAALNEMLASLEVIGEQTVIGDVRAETQALLGDLNLLQTLDEQQIQSFEGPYQLRAKTQHLSRKLNELGISNQELAQAMEELKKGQTPGLLKRAIKNAERISGCGSKLILVLLIAVLVGLLTSIGYLAVIAGANNAKWKKAQESMRASNRKNAKVQQLAIEIHALVQQFQNPAVEGQQAAINTGGNLLDVSLNDQRKDVLHFNARRYASSLAYIYNAKQIPPYVRLANQANSGVDSSVLEEIAEPLIHNYLLFLSSQTAYAISRSGYDSSLQTAERVLNSNEPTDARTEALRNGGGSLLDSTPEKNIQQLETFFRALKQYLQDATHLTAHSQPHPRAPQMKLFTFVRETKTNIPDNTPSQQDLLNQLRNLPDALLNQIPKDCLPPHVSADGRGNITGRSEWESARAFLEALITESSHNQRSVTQDCYEWVVSTPEVPLVLQVKGSHNQVIQEVLGHGDRIEQLVKRFTALSPDAEARMDRSRTASRQMSTQATELQRLLEEFEAEMKRLEKEADDINEDYGANGFNGAVWKFCEMMNDTFGR